MAKHARLTPPARADLRALRDWLTREAGAMRARRFVERLLQHCHDVAGMPMAGRLRREFGGDVRSTVVPPYVILYEPRPYGMRVLRIIHGHRDIDRVWREET